MLRRPCSIVDYLWSQDLLRCVGEVCHTDWHLLYAILACRDDELGRVFSSVSLGWEGSQAHFAFCRSILRLKRASSSMPLCSLDLLTGRPMTRKSSRILILTIKFELVPNSCAVEVDPVSYDVNTSTNRIRFCHQGRRFWYFARTGMCGDLCWWTRVLDYNVL